MDCHEASEILALELATFRARPYQELCNVLDETAHNEVIGPSGTTYYVEIQVFWDNTPDADLRVLGAIDDGSWRAFVPLTDSFIVAPDGSFVGE